MKRLWYLRIILNMGLFFLYFYLEDFMNGLMEVSWWGFPLAMLSGLIIVGMNFLIWIFDSEDFKEYFVNSGDGKK